MNFWIYSLWASIPGLLFQGPSVSAESNFSLYPNSTESNFSLYPNNTESINNKFKWCTPAVTCNSSEENTTCTHREYRFTENPSNGSLLAWLDESIKVICDASRLDIFGVTSNRTTKIIRFTKNDHRKTISCYDDRSVGGVTVNTSVTIDLLMKPVTDVTEKTFQSRGGPVSMKFNFEANPTFVTKDNIKITHKNTHVANFFHRSTGLTHEILVYFEEINEQNEGEYQIRITAMDSRCQPAELIIVGTVLGKDLHMGWIVSIVLGGFSFVLLVVVIFCTVSRCCKREKYDKANVEMKNTRPVVDSTSVNGLRQQVSSPQIQNSPPQISSPIPQAEFQRGNPSYNRYSEDEFDSDSDDGEATSTTLHSRPPMPLPKENPLSQFPRSPAATGYMTGVTNHPTPTKGNNFPMAPLNCPPPPVGRPPASPRNRSLPPPPPLQDNFGYREGRY